MILYALLKNFGYLQWTGIAISAKEGTLAKDHTFPVLDEWRVVDIEGKIGDIIGDDWVRVPSLILDPNQPKQSHEQVST